MRFAALAVLATAASAVTIQQTTKKMSEEDVGHAMEDIGEFINDHVDEYGKFDLHDAFEVCKHIAKEHGYKKCPKAVKHAIREAFHYCDTNDDGFVSPAEFHKCYNATSDDE